MTRTETSQLERMRRLAREVFGFQALYPYQEDVIRSVVEGHDTLAVMPTGSGKSAMYQIAGLMIPGPAVVIAPLIALQRDQVEKLADHEEVDALLLNSTLAAAERRAALTEIAGEDGGFLRRRGDRAVRGGQDGRAVRRRGLQGAADAVRGGVGGSATGMRLGSSEARQTHPCGGREG